MFSTLSKIHNFDFFHVLFDARFNCLPENTNARACFKKYISTKKWFPRVR